MHERPDRVLAYTRVSSLEQSAHGTSLAAQREEVTRHCKASGYPEPVIFVEAESGAASKAEVRVEQLRLMASVKTGDLVLVAKQDRWSRDTLHFLRSVDEIMLRGGRFFSLAERFDPSTPEGRFVSTIMAATAEQERARIRERTVGSRQRLRGLGQWVEGPPPYGYRVEARGLVAEPAQAEVVRAIFALYLEGHSTAEVAMWIADAHPGENPDRGAIHRRLRDRRYLGDMPAVGKRGARGQGTGEWLTAAHEPIVDRVTFERVQRALEERRIGGRPLVADARNAHFLLRGIAACGACGRSLVAHAPMPSESTQHGGWYHCRGKCLGHVRQDRVDDVASVALLGRLGALAEELAHPTISAAVPVDYTGPRARAERRRSNLVTAIADGTISRGDARAKLDEIARELDALAAKEADAAARAVEIPASVRAAALADVRQVRRAWKRLEAAERRDAAAMLAESVALHREGTRRRWERAGAYLEPAWYDLTYSSPPTCRVLRLPDVPFAGLRAVLGRAA